MAIEYVPARNQFDHLDEEKTLSMAVRIRSEAAINDWKNFTDEDAHYDKVLTPDVNELVPFVTRYKS